MASETVLDLARQGDSKVIAALINGLTRPKGITVKVTILKRCLHVLLESPHRLNQNATTTFIHQLIAQLDVQGVEQIKLYARQTGGVAIAWSRDITWRSQDGLEPMFLALEGDDRHDEVDEVDEVGEVGEVDEVDEVDGGLEQPSAESMQEVAVNPMELSLDLSPPLSPAFVDPLTDAAPAGSTPEPLDASGEPMDESIAGSGIGAIAPSIPDPWFNDEPEGLPLVTPSRMSTQSLAAPPPISERDQVSSESQPETVPHDVWEPAPLEHPVTEADVVSSNPSMFDAELDSSMPLPSPSGMEELPCFDDDDNEEIDESSDLLQRPEAALLIIFAFLVALWDIYLDLIEEPGAEQPVSGRELARRLGVNNSTISRRKERPDFSAWAQDLDPDGIAWIYQDGLFVPQLPTEPSA